MSFGFSYVGLVWLLMLMIPNIIWTKHQPSGYAAYASKENKILLAFERTGQFIVTPSALIFSDFNYKGWNFWLPVLGLSFLLMVLYDIAWVRYFRSEKTMKDFYRSFLGIPLCLATYPVIAFFLLGIYGGNIIMLIGSVILGIGHIGIHAQHAREVFGPKAKSKLIVRVLKWIAIAILALIGASFMFLIAGRNIRQLQRFISYKDGVNEQIYVQLNDQEEYIVISGKSEDNPVIISLHGGPSAPTTFVDYCWQDYLTDDYTVVAWDERGCGRSYYRNADVDPDNSTLTFEQQLEDLDALVDYCCERFGQEQVIILGHSYGSMLGSEYAFAHPEKVSAYIGVGQCVNEADYYGETYSYQDALRIARENGDDTTEMEDAYDRFMADKSLTNLMALRDIVSPYHPMTDTTDVSTYAALTSPVVGVDDIRWYLLEMSTFTGNSRFEELIAPLEGELQSFVLEGDYQMPAMFISGDCDWICPFGLAEEYADSNGCEYAEMEGCGHSPQGQHPDQFADIIRGFLTQVN